MSDLNAVKQLNIAQRRRQRLVLRWADPANGEESQSEPVYVSRFRVEDGEQKVELERTSPGRPPLVVPVNAVTLIHPVAARKAA